MKKSVLMTIIFVLIFALGIYFYEKDQKVPVRVAKVITGQVSEYVEERAKTSLPRLYHITMPLDGRITPIILRAGTKVKKGQVVAVMEVADLETELAEATAGVEVIKAQIKLNEFNKIEDTAKVESDKWIATLKKLVLASSRKVQASKQVADYSKEYETTVVESGKAMSRIEQSKAKMETAVSVVDYENSQTIYNATVILQTIFQLAELSG